ncbi:polypeptide N-acetylgalactosaminyltransferase 5 [Electrophorus electricus]|uniref:polypeptide N-acetylgalactosaminyltransferase 5 n=1 Tax=Electrophorus electricus TaxID=8005 RepID=UPI0015D0242B|nr:polypeptide N-acetylgalactosaminyltransferase 5 [Electrophorus electricus]
MKLRKYLRGSGRVLAFVFIASVIWLLFDMAALRLSINDVNSQLLKELVVKERDLAKRQRTQKTSVSDGDFKHPLQKVEGLFQSKIFSFERKVADVYRKRPGEIPAQLSDQAKAQLEKYTQVKTKIDNETSTVTKQQKTLVNESKSKVRVNLKPSAKEPPFNRFNKGTDTSIGNELLQVTQQAAEQGLNENSKKVTVSDTKAPPAVQEEKFPTRLLERKSMKLQSNATKNDTTLVQVTKLPVDVAIHGKFSSNNTKPVKQEAHLNISKAVYPVKPVQRVTKEIGSKFYMNSKDKQYTVRNTSPRSITHMAQVSPKPLQMVEDQLNQWGGEQVQLQNSTGRRRASERHKVMALDMTNRPRDMRAVGQFGQAAVVPPDRQEESWSRWSEGYFNVFLSEQIPVDRAIPDTRPPACAENLVHDDLPMTSVIFCFMDEVWSTLLRSVHSVLNRSPPHLLKEVLLVDDCSTKDYLKEKLEAYMSQFPKVRIIRLKERHGLIRARLAGAAVAKGDVLTFLDSHIECNVGWLEPLLEQVYMERKRVACPVIEVISDKDMSYVMVDNFQKGIFKWPLVFGWSTLSQDVIKKNNMNDSDPIRCPVMAGGLFSIDKQYFYELGTYDPGLDVWGGENMELSFKIWMCGGEIEIIPCSRVGHIFRGENPYKFPKNRQKTVERNLARVAEVWLDEYKELFYGHGYLHLLDRNGMDIGNLTEQIQLRKKLGCKSFSWYLENIYPELEAPIVKAEGPVLNMGIRKCLVLDKGSLFFEICDLKKQNQHFNYSWVRTFRQDASCVSPHKTGTGVAMEPCDNTKPHLRWLHKSTQVLTDHLIAEASPQQVCLEAEPEGGGVFLKACEAANPFQKWQFTHYYAQ